MAPSALARPSSTQNATSGASESKKVKIVSMVVGAATIGMSVYFYTHHPFGQAQPCLGCELVGTREVPCAPPPPNVRNPPTSCVEPVWGRKRNDWEYLSVGILGAVALVVPIVTW